MLNIIKKYKNTAHLLELFTADDDNGFALGYVRKNDENYVLLEGIDTVAEYAGISLFNLEGVTEIKSNTIYALKFQQYLLKTNYTNKVFDVSEVNLFGNFIRYLRKKQEITTIVTLASGEYTGFISDIFDGSVELTIINRNGYLDGIISINFTEILSVTIESRNEKNFGILHSIKM